MARDVVADTEQTMRTKTRISQEDLARARDSLATLTTSHATDVSDLRQALSQLCSNIDIIEASDHAAAHSLDVDIAELNGAIAIVSEDVDAARQAETALAISRMHDAAVLF